ncbi:MAG: ABC transporter ATP-binding protein [Patescibacteria group bacterium]
MSSIIEVKNLSKKYTIGDRQGYVALRDVMMNIIKSPLSWFGNKVKLAVTHNKYNEFWALKNVSFSVEKGEVLGIIGRNGAGKSTLLKILSQITPPTGGEVRLGGRVGSLLEVGTGFHPELTGRENIYLNGAILGMKKKEIKAKFNEIVKFAEIEKFLDTPVKRYSSGMYVRLAFAVAAHLEPEVLIIDEVLAVGDADFQRKCLGKMSDITKKDGRTVLFVSHNLDAVERLCSRTMLINDGEVVSIGETKEIIALYKSKVSSLTVKEMILPPRDNTIVVFEKISMNTDDAVDVSDGFEIGQKIRIKLEFNIKESAKDIEISFKLRNSHEVDIMFSSLSDSCGFKFYEFQPGKYSAEIEIPNNFLMPGLYHIDLFATRPGFAGIDAQKDVICFRVFSRNTIKEINYGMGCVVSNATWSVTPLGRKTS